ncbi:hypothetical protein [Kocuria atrinae]|uniref:hypothetical protein n=1 Tax=Kocuria atrinae TaxID=592377 RepID=UPI0002DA3048|nr:hypothetical protein [Kocuria atrinae]
MRFIEWALLAGTALTIGLLRTTVQLMVDGADNASTPLLVLLIAGPLTVITYFAVRWSGKKLVFGTFLASTARVFLSCLIAALLYALPGLIFDESGLLDLSLTLLFAFVMALILATIMARFLRHQVPDTPEDLA